MGCSLALAIPLAIGLYWYDANAPIGTLKIGFHNSPPYQFPDAHGNPAGPAVDLIKAAAERSHIRLEWVWAPDGPEEMLRSGKTDLWPVVVDLPERHSILYVTAPWAKLSYSILAPKSSSVSRPSDVVGKTLAVSTGVSTDARQDGQDEQQSACEGFALSVGEKRASSLGNLGIPVKVNAGQGAVVGHLPDSGQKAVGPPACLPSFQGRAIRPASACCVHTAASTSSEALLTVINDILDFSKIEAGGLVIESFGLDLRQVIEEVAEMLQPKAEENGNELIVQYSPDRPRMFLGDAGRIRQVVTNLVANGVKFTHKGHVLVSVECEPADLNHAGLRITVADTGIGIPAEKIGMLFEKFTQADTSTTRRYGGTGLGLSISKQLVELMGGSIHVESRVGQGSQFICRLHLRGYVAPALPPEPGDKAAFFDQFQGNHLRVLVAEDNVVNQKVGSGHSSAWRYGRTWRRTAGKQWS